MNEYSVNLFLHKFGSKYFSSIYWNKNYISNCFYYLFNKLFTLIKKAQLAITNWTSDYYILSGEDTPINCNALRNVI